MTSPIGVSNAGGDIRGTVLSASSAKRTPSPWKGVRRHLLDLQQLETFRVLASTRHFTSAAVQLGYCQSTVTVHIKALEHQLGVILFERFRFSKNVVLTEAGRRTLEYAERFLALAEETQAAVRGVRKKDDPTDSR